MYSKSVHLVRALARVLNAEARALPAKGARLLQIDAPFLAGYPEEVGVAVEAINIVTTGVEAPWGLHVCYGNRYARSSWERHDDFLFPTVLDANVDQLILEFARKGYEDLEVIQGFGWDRALDTFPADKLIINPDCGLRHLPAHAARSKLAAVVEGTVMVPPHPAYSGGPRTVTSPEPTVEQGA